MFEARKNHIIFLKIKEIGLSLKHTLDKIR